MTKTILNLLKDWVILILLVIRDNLTEANRNTKTLKTRKNNIIPIQRCRTGFSKRKIRFKIRNQKILKEENLRKSQTTETKDLLKIIKKEMVYFEENYSILFIYYFIDFA